MSGQVQTQGTSEWQNGPLGCFADKRLCILSFCVPCYVIGKNAAEGLGEDCLLTGLLSALGLPFGPVIRWRLRQEKGLKGSMLMDVLMWTILPCCSLAQEAREIGWSLPKEVANLGKKKEGASNPDQVPDMDRQ